MGFRFFKRMQVIPGITLNFSKSGVSTSFGPKGLKYTVGPKGTRYTAGIPGTGLYYTTTKGPGKNKRATASPASPPEMGFLQRLTLTNDEKILLQGFEKLGKGDTSGASVIFQSSNCTDCRFMSGFLAIGRDQYAEAEQFLLQARSPDLGTMVTKIGGEFELLLDITEYIEAPIGVDDRGWSLCMVEALQGQEKYGEAVEIINDEWEKNVQDKVICLSLTELVAMSQNASAQELKDIVKMTQDVENSEPIDTNILYLRAYVLYRLNLVDAGTSQLTSIIRKAKDRPEELMMDIRYLRGQMYEENGEGAKAKKDYQQIYSQKPTYGDVASKLDLN